MTDAWLIIETSGRDGRVGVARGDRVFRKTRLDSSVKRNADLALRTGTLLAEAGLKPTELLGVMVSIGPGSFTGLRVGVISAKTFAYSTNCRLVAVPTFHAIARGTPASYDRVDVIADALKGNIFLQSFRRSSGQLWESISDTRIVPVEAWRQDLDSATFVSGPGLDVHEKSIPESIPCADANTRNPSLDSILQVGLRLPPLSRAELMNLEPLYLRGSSAEEKAAELTRPQAVS